MMSTWQIDSAHTVVSFAAQHMMITRVRGLFKQVSGTVHYDEADPTRSSVEVTIPAATIDTGVEARDNHLRSADFLDAATHPALTFRSSAIEKRGERWAISGGLTIRGVTRPVVLDTNARDRDRHGRPAPRGASAAPGRARPPAMDVRRSRTRTLL
jgi:polyisoprenoid-binding protein YceI